MPCYEVMVAPGFFDGQRLHPPGTKLDLPADYIPSATFKGLDEEANMILNDLIAKMHPDSRPQAAVAPPPLQRVFPKVVTAPMDAASKKK